MTKTPPEATGIRLNRFGKNKIFNKNDREAGLEPKGWFRSCFCILRCLLTTIVRQLLLIGRNTVKDFESGRSAIKEKKLRNKEKNACNVKKSVLSCKGCGMIAVKREVAAQEAGFPWSECQVRKLATSHCTIKEFCFKKTENQCGVLEDTHGNVYSHRLSYFY